MEGGHPTEAQIAEKLDTLRLGQEGCLGPSFITIKCVADPLRHQQDPFPRKHLLHRFLRCLIGQDFNTQPVEMRPHLCIQLRRVDKEQRAVGQYCQISERNRVIGDVPPAQIEQPCNVVYRQNRSWRGAGSPCSTPAIRIARRLRIT